MKNFNDEARNLITGYMKDTKMSWNFKIDLLTEKVSDLITKSNLESQILNRYLLSIIYLDAYKVYSWREKENKLTPFQESTFKLIYDIQNYEELIWELSINQEILKRMIIASFEVGKMDDINKIILMKSLSAGENEFLKKEWPMHQQDQETYNIKITIEILLELIKKKQEKSNSIAYPFPLATIFSISGFLKNLLKYDFNNALRLFERLAYIDYTVANHLKEQNYTDKLYKNHLDFYDTTDYGNIMHRMMTDQEFLWVCIESLQNLYISKKFKSLELPEIILAKEENRNMKRKLHLEENEL